MKKGGSRGAKGMRGVSAKARPGGGFSDIEALKQIVLRRHPEWHPRKRGHYLFYIVVFLIVIAGIYFLTDNRRVLSPLAYFVIFSITVLLAAAFLLMIRYHLRQNSRESLEELVESEILRFTHERSRPRRS